MSKPLSELKVQIYADGADTQGIIDLYKNPLIKGLTTNPTLMKRAGVKDYEAYAKEILQTVKTKPISFEVFSDDLTEMRKQALKIKSWAPNVYTKIPIINSNHESSIPLIQELAAEGVQLNVTAILTLTQVRELADALNPKIPAIVSIFAGRIADTGRDPIPYMTASSALLEGRPKAELLWASVREVLNIYQADACGCQIVTVPHDILAKALKMVGTKLDDVSLDTVKTFSADAKTAGFTIQT